MTSSSIGDRGLMTCTHDRLAPIALCAPIRDHSTFCDSVRQVLTLFETFCDNQVRLRGSSLPSVQFVGSPDGTRKLRENNSSVKFPGTCFCYSSAIPEHNPKTVLPSRPIITFLTSSGATSSKSSNDTFAVCHGRKRAGYCFLDLNHRNNHNFLSRRHSANVWC
jgi:hypothetical protein